MIDYLKRKMAILSIALARVEKSSLNQVSDALGSEEAINQTMNHGSMADALLKGEITTSVKEMRWRLYKILNAVDNYKSVIVGYDKDGLPITETNVVNKMNLSKIKKDDYDDYKIEMVFNNEDVMKSTTEAFGNDKLKVLTDSEIEGFNKENKLFNLGKDETVDESIRKNIITEEDEIRTLGVLKFDDMVSTMKSNKLINIVRSIRPKFEIEQYTNKLMVRTITEEKKLLEFYLSKYPDVFDKKSVFLISELKKLIKNPKEIDLLDIEMVGFISDKTIGVDNGLEFIYKIIKFDKIIEFNGNYVIKFLAETIVNGQNIYEKYKLDELEKRYESKEKKDLNKK